MCYFIVGGADFSKLIQCNAKLLDIDRRTCQNPFVNVPEPITKTSRYKFELKEFHVISHFCL
jgi:hypothetical protein